MRATQTLEQRRGSRLSDVTMTYDSTAVNRLDEMVSKRMGGIAAGMRTVRAVKV